MTKQHDSRETRESRAAAPEASAVPEIAKGTLIGRYVVLGELGRGAMGAVYAAFDPDLDRRVALKLVAPRRGEARADLSREAKVLAKLEHPNVATVHDVGFWSELLFIAMELVDGGDLESWLAEPRSTSAIVEVFGQAGRGLAAAHARGVVHRDFKPTNALMGSDGRVRVADFGLARIATEVVGGVRPGDSIRSLVATHTSLAGTPDFMAPELYDGRPATVLSDQYAYCVALYWALTGHRRQSEHATAKLRIPAPVRRALLRGLEADPDRRFASMDELLAAIDRGRRSRSPFVYGAAIGLVGAAVGAWSAFGSGERRDRCGELRADWEQTYGESRRAGLRAALADVDVSYADDRARRVVAALDAYAEEWNEELEAACTASDGAGKALASCLDARRGEFDALADVLEDGTPETLAGSLDAVLALRSPRSCRDPAATGWTAPKLARESDPRVAHALRKAEALDALGEFERALVEAELALALAEELDDPLLARAHFATGSAAYGLGDFARAERALRDAVTEAVALGEDGVAAEAIAQLITVVGVERSNEDAGAVWVELGQATVKRIGGETLAEADIEDAAGVFEASLGNWTKSRAHHERGLELRRRFLGESHPVVGLSLSNLATLDLEEARFEDAIETAKHSLAIREAAYGEMHPDVATSRSLLGALYFQTGDIEQARDQLEQALHIGEATLGPSHSRVASIRNNLAGVLNRQGEHGRARDLYLQALETWEAERGRSDPKVATAYNNVASTAFRIGDTQTAITHFEAAIEIWQATFGEDHPKVASGLMGLGNALLQAERCDEAVEALDSAVSTLQNAKESGTRVLAFALHGSSRALACAGQADRAYDRAEQAVAQAKEIYGEQSPWLGPLYANLSELTLARGDAARALELAEFAVERAESPDFKGMAHYALAQARAKTDPDPDRAREAAEVALEELPAENPRWIKKRAEIQAFVDGLK